MRICSLLTSLRKLTLYNVAVSLPALQPVASRLHELDIFGSRLQDSADGFLTRGWTALTMLSLTCTHMESANMTAALELAALEELDIIRFRHQGGGLQLEQLTGSCPNIKELRLQLDSDMARGIEGRAPCCSLLKLGRLTDLYVSIEEEQLPCSLDLDLPASLTLFVVEGTEYGVMVDFFWALSEAAKCIRSGAQLRRLSCYPAHACLQPAQWAASLDEQYRRLGGQLSSLRELEVWGDTQRLLNALFAVVSSAPHLTFVNLTIMEWQSGMELPPICSASLESISVTAHDSSGEVPIPPLVLTFLPGCTRLQKALVRLPNGLTTEGTAVKIRCHCGSPTSVVPMDVHACAAEHRRVHGYACSFFSAVGVHFLPGSASLQGAPSYTVLHSCHAAGPQQPLTWGHVVMPGIV